MATASTTRTTLRQISSVSEAGLTEELDMLQNIYMEQELRVNSLDR